MLSRRRKLLFALITFALVAGLMMIVLAVADLYVHHRTQEVAGVNIWGYRGKPIGAKRAGEVRVAIFGGSTAYGWGLPANESIAAFLERRLNESPATRPFSVVNLGAPGQGAYGFLTDLADYEFLDYDIVVLYEGYNDLANVTVRGYDNYLQWRRESPVFRWTGYYPVLPVVLLEKADLMTGKAKDDEVRFRAGIGARVAGGAMRAVAAVTGDLAGKVGGVTPVPPNAPVDGECAQLWARYCGSVRDAITWATARHKHVIFVTQPYVSDAHRQQQDNVVAMITARFGGDARVAYVNLGDALDLHNRDISYDGTHLVAHGNDTIASRLIEPVREAAK